MVEPINASDLLRMGYEDDMLLLEDMSLCTSCSSTCSVTVVTQQ